MAAADHPLGYMRAHPNNGVVYTASDMTLKFSSDVSYASNTKGRSVAGGLLYAGNADCTRTTTASTAASIVSAAAASASSPRPPSRPSWPRST